MNMMTGYLALTEGQILINGYDVAEEPMEARKCIGYLPEIPPLYPDMTVLEYLCFAAELKQVPKNERSTEIERVMDETRIKDMENRLIRHLSKGYKQRVGIAQTLIGNPDIIILDEPTSGLDPVVRDDLLDLFLEFVQDEEHAILISTHITSDLEKVADYVTFLHAGKLLLSKPKDELLWQYGILRCGEALFQKLESPEVLAWRKKDYSYDVLVPDREAILRKYPEAVIDQVTMDEILLLYVKGVQGK